MVEDLIYDVGVVNGDDKAYYLFRGYPVIGIEANPILVAQACVRFATAIRADKLMLLNIGIGPRRETATFWVNERVSEWSSFVREDGCQNGTPCHSIEVRCQRLREVLDEHGTPFYLKIDIAGHDKYCLEDIRALDSPVYVSCEARSLEYLSLLSSRGYNSFKLLSQMTNNPPLDRRLLSRIQRRLFRLVRGDVWSAGGVGPGRKWLFPFGSSGPFGEETPGPWLSIPEVADRFEEKPQRNWFDFHAKRDVNSGTVSRAGA